MAKASRFHPIEDGLWSDQKFDADLLLSLQRAPFLTRAFFAYLTSNFRQRPSGIYRATDAQLAADAELSEADVTAMIADLHTRGLVVRDGAWLFVKSYFARLPKQPFLLRAAEAQVRESPQVIRCAFRQKYPLFSQWSCDHCDVLNGNCSVERRGEERRGTKEELEAGSDQTPPAVVALDPALHGILQECPHLALVSTVLSSEFWDQVLGACEPYPMADGRWLGAKLRAWNHWFECNPSRRSRDRKRLESRLFGWLQGDLEKLARVKA